MEKDSRFLDNKHLSQPAKRQLLLEAHIFDT